MCVVLLQESLNTQRRGRDTITIFPGMPLENYEYMLSVYREFCSGG